MQQIIRHLIAAAGGFLCLDTSSTTSILGGAAAILITVLWSWIQKLGIFAPSIFDDKTKDAGRKFVGALVSQLISAFSGALINSGFAGDVNDPAAVALFLGNVTASKLGWHQRALGASVPLWLLLFSLSAILPACSSTSQEALKQRLEEAFVSAGREVSAVALQSAIATLKHELALLEAKPVDDDPMQQLIDQNRMQAMRAAIRLGEERLAKLRAPGAKQPRQVVPETTSTHPTHKRALAVRGRDSTRHANACIASAHSIKQHAEA